MLSRLLTHRYTIWYFAVRPIFDRYASTCGGLSVFYRDDMSFLECALDEIE